MEWFTFVALHGIWNFVHQQHEWRQQHNTNIHAYTIQADRTKSKTDIGTGSDWGEFPICAGARAGHNPNSASVHVRMYLCDAIYYYPPNSIHTNTTRARPYIDTIDPNCLFRYGQYIRTQHTRTHNAKPMEKRLHANTQDQTRKFPLNSIQWSL